MKEAFLVCLFFTGGGGGRDTHTRTKRGVSGGWADERMKSVVVNDVVCTVTILACECRRRYSSPRAESEQTCT